MLKSRGQGFEGKTCVVSGSGNVAIYTIEKVQAAGRQGGGLLRLQRRIVHDPDGIDLELVKQLKEVERRRIRSYVDERKGATYVDGGNIWDGALPGGPALRHAERAHRQGRRHAGEERLHRRRRGRQHAHHPRGHPRLPGGRHRLRPGQGGQRRRRRHQRRWRCSRTPAATPGPSSTPSSGCTRSCATSTSTCYETAEEYGSPGNYVVGANIAGFIKVAKAMVAHGLI